jgi:hypothetical protein
MAVARFGALDLIVIGHAAGVVWLAGWCLAEEPKPALPPDVLACRRQLLLIHDAVESYRRSHDRWPERLSDLAGVSLSPEVLICPECVRRRVFRLRDENLLNIVGSDWQTAYKWELNTLEECPGMLDKKWYDWKQRQRETPVGDAVPIVRCDQHKVNGESVHLNLTFGGDVFISGTYWEEAFRDVLALPYLETPRQVFLNVQPIPKRVPSRPPAATTGQIDLGPLATALPGDPWQDGKSSDSMAGLVAAVGPNGLWAHGGVEFDLRALIQLDGRRLGLQEKAVGRREWYYPTKPVVIPVGRAARKIHMLGGVVFPAPEGAEVGGLRVMHAGGTVQVIPWRYGIDLRDGWSDQQSGEEAGKLAWTAPAFTPKEPGVPKRIGPLKVYHWSVDLERPGEAIESCEFFSSATNPDVSKQYPSGPFLLAVSLE